MEQTSKHSDAMRCKRVERKNENKNVILLLSIERTWKSETMIFKSCSSRHSLPSSSSLSLSSSSLTLSWAIKSQKELICAHIFKITNEIEKHTFSPNKNHHMFETTDDYDDYYYDDDVNAISHGFNHFI